MSTGPSRPLRLQVVGEKPGEGNPADPGQARLQVSRHEQGGGASVGPQGARPSLPALEDSTCSHSLLEGGRNAGKAEGSRAARTVCVQVSQRIWATVDTTIDELDVYHLTMVARVNGEEWSRGSSSTIMWQVEEIIAYSSKGEGLQAGELIGSGTVGWGCGLELGKLLKPGDVVELEVEGIGVLRNRLGTPAPTGWMPQRRTPAAV